MTTADVRTRVRAIILAILGLLVFTLVLRVIFDFLDASTSNFLVQIITNITDVLIDPFEGIIDGRNSDINYDALISIGIYTLLGIALSEIVTAFIYDSFNDIFKNIVDAIFKVVEFVLILRIIFDFFLIENKIGFVESIRSLTDWTGSIGIQTNFLEGRLNVAAIIILIIVVILDFLTESFIDAFFRLFKTTPSKKVVKTTMPTPIVVQNQPQQVVARNNPIPVQHNITVNVPPQNVYNTQVRPVILPVNQNPNAAVQRQAVPYNRVILQPVPPTSPAPNPAPQNTGGYVEYHDGKPVN